jgi:hypothetical protein
MFANAAAELVERRAANATPPRHGEGGPSEGRWVEFRCASASKQQPQFIVGKAKAAPDLMPSGHRVVIVLTRV